MGDGCHGRRSQRAQCDVVQHPSGWAPHALPQWSVLPRVLAPRGVRVSRRADDRARPGDFDRIACRPAVGSEPHALDDPRGAAGGRRHCLGSRPLPASEGEAPEVSASPFPFSLQIASVECPRSSEGFETTSTSVPNLRSLSTTERRYSEPWIRGAADARSLPGVDGGTEEGLDPALPPRAPREGREVRVPDPPRTARPVERVLRPQGGDAVSGAPAARGARVRAEPVAGAGERHAEEVLPTHGPRADRAERGTGDLGRDDPRRGRGAGRSPMTPSEDYVGRVRRAMAGMEPAVRDDILRELRSHIAESTAANGGNVGSSLTALGTPEEVGRRYRELYGYGRGFKGLFSVIAFLLAFASVPVLSVGSESLFPYALSLVILIIAAAWILWVSVAAGFRAGGLAGLGAMVSRFGAFGLWAGDRLGAPARCGGLGLLGVVSPALVVIRVVPGA